jgi:hypothetical protein
MMIKSKSDLKSLFLQSTQLRQMAFARIRMLVVFRRFNSSKTVNCYGEHVAQMEL